MYTLSFAMRQDQFCSIKFIYKLSAVSLLSNFAMHQAITATQWHDS
jgi:hypothetical protein